MRLGRFSVRRMLWACSGLAVVLFSTSEASAQGRRVVVVTGAPYYVAAPAPVIQTQAVVVSPAPAPVRAVYAAPAVSQVVTTSYQPVATPAPVVVQRVVRAQPVLVQPMRRVRVLHPRRAYFTTFAPY